MFLEVASLPSHQSVLQEKHPEKKCSYHSIKTLKKHVQKSRHSGWALNLPNQTTAEFDSMLTAQKAILLLDGADTVLQFITSNKQQQKSIAHFKSVFYLKIKSDLLSKNTNQG